MTRTALKNKVAETCSLIGRTFGGRINYALGDDELSKLLRTAERNGLLERRPELDRDGGQVFDLTEKGLAFAYRREELLGL